MSTAAQTPDLSSQVLKGKYDNRKFNGARKAHRKSPTDFGPKPNWIKHLGASNAFNVLRELDSIAPPALIYTRAFERGLLSLCWEMRCYVEDRLLGKPFTAINPAEQKAPHTLINDNRLQVAVQSLLPGAKPKAKRSKTRSVEAKIVDSKGLSGDVAGSQPDPGTQEGPHPV